MILRVRIPRTLHEWHEKGEHFFHMTYLGFTYVEGHGWHANAAGALFVIVFTGLFMHGGGE